MARNKFVSSSSLTSAAKLRAVTPHASNELPEGPCRALYVGVGGNINLIAEDDTDPISFVGVQAGAIIPVRAKAVRVSGTTATNLVAMY